MPEWTALRESAQRWGWPRALFQRLMGMLEPRVGVYRIHLRALGNREPPDVDGGLDVRRMTREELYQLADSLPSEIDRPFIDAALERGDFCTAAFDGNTVAAFVWRSFSTAPHGHGLWVGFEKPYRYGYKAYTLPAYRGRHLQDPTAIVSDQECLANGFTYALSYVAIQNFPSIRSDMRRGNRLVGFAGYVRLFGRAFPFRWPGVRKHGFRFYTPAAEGG